MDKFDRINTLHRILSESQRPVSTDELEQELRCSPTNISRIIAESKDFLDAPIKYDHGKNGYYYDNATKQHYELPGLWFNASELYALLAAHQLLSNVKPGFLEPHIAPLKQRLLKILKLETYDHQDIFKRIRILQMGAKNVAQNRFAVVATSLLSRKRTLLHYHGRNSDKETQREVSPQRLIYYRDNWYLDAWCHMRRALRSFALDRINSAKLSTKSAINIDDEKLDKHYRDAYGIFAGKAKSIAVLRFSQQITPWIINEQWHSRQKGQHTLDGCYELEIPYGDPRELIMDILKYGPEVEVIKPAGLRDMVAKKLSAASQLYTDPN